MKARPAPPTDTARRLAATIPFILTGSLVLAALLPVHGSVLRVIGPSLPLVAIYYWAAHRPELLPRPAVFLIGLIADMLHGTPLGAAALSYALVYEVAMRNRSLVLGKPFWALWAGMAVVAPAAYGAQWLLVSLFQGVPPPYQPVLGQAAVALLLFPWLSWPLLLVQRRLLHGV